MTIANRMKYEACSHAREVLLNSKVNLAEVTGDPVWGTGLNVSKMLECLPEFWPGQNLMGHILMELQVEFQLELRESEKKCKAESPMGQQSKNQKV